MVEDPGKRESRYKTHAEKEKQRQRNREQERGKLTNEWPGQVGIMQLQPARNRLILVHPKETG